MKHLYLLTLLVVFLFSNLDAAVYYVDSQNGNDSNSGLSASSAWKTIAKVNSAKFLPGDNILFKSGSVWREQLNVLSSGLAGVPVTFGSYGTGSKPVISGSNLQTGFVVHSGYIWKVSLSNYPEQIFFNNIRGNEKSSLSSLKSERDWYYDSSGKKLYIYSVNNPSNYKSPGIEAAIRYNAVYINAKNIVVKDLQVEKTAHNAVHFTSNASGVTIDNIDFLQWTDAENSARAGVVMDGTNNVVKNCTFGKNTGNDLADQNWAGFVAILVSGSNSEIHDNKIYHSSTENENNTGAYAYAIRLVDVSGKTKVYKNYIYHPGSHGIAVVSNTRSGDEIYIYENTIEYPGQAGISAYKTRGEDGIGGKGYVYKNTVCYANRLGGDVGGNGTQASGIHFNDGVRAGTDPKKPYMKWYCYENIVHSNRALKVPNSPDASGISMDYNANRVEVYRNIVYNNYSKGIYIWNANNCKIYYNLIYGNDAGTTITALNGGVESADNNQVFNNTYYKNYNGNDKGANIHAEIYFGMNGHNNIIKNNIIFSAREGYALVYNNKTNTWGHQLDNNIIYSERSIVANDSYNGQMTFDQWRKAHPEFDKYSKNADPQFNNPSSGDFTLKPTSPAIDGGAVIGVVNDLLGRLLNGVPDIGAFEFIPTSKTEEPGNDVILINALTGTLSGGAGLGSKNGMLNERAVYFKSDNGAATFNVNIPKAGTWCAYARMFYYSSGEKNSFYISIKGNKQILGDDDTKYNQWHWDGYKGSKINLGYLESGNQTLIVSAREPGLTLWVDQVVLTNNPDYVPTDNKAEDKIETPSVPSQPILINAMDGKLSGGAGLGSKTGMNNERALYFKSIDGSALYSVDIPREGTWYAFARMFYYSSGQKNSFFMTLNGNQQVLGDDDSKYDKWHWDGYKGTKINLGKLKAAKYDLRISAREPGLTLWVDQIVLTDDPNYSPDGEVSTLQPVPSSKPILLNAMEGTLSGGAGLGTKNGMNCERAVYFRESNGSVLFTVDIPRAGNWYAWARMFYYSSGQKNSFYITVNGIQQVLGDDDSKYDQWHWDGSKGSKIDLGRLEALKYYLRISAREPGLTLWVDQIILTDDPDYNPNTALGKTTEGNQDENISNVPQQFELSQNYPNPFNPATTIRFSIAEKSFVSLKVFDILGNEVAELINGEKAPGSYEINFDESNLSSGRQGLSSGTYIYRIEAGEFIQTRKMILLK